MYRSVLPLLLAAGLLLSGCTAGQKKEAQETKLTEQSSDMSGEERVYMDTTENVIYLAGGCFWGMQAYFEQLHGIMATEVGYANGHVENPTYEMVCSGTTGYAEALHIQYDASVITLRFLLSLYYDVIDPTSYHRQGNDIGEQYRTGIYYVDEADQPVIEASLQELAKCYREPIAVEMKPLTSFYSAEEYHQEYLKKNPGGYCHISRQKILAAASIRPK